jgi:DNA-binding MarR family transcriptional regulator
VARRLTDGEVAVLAAIERLGSPLLADLRRDLRVLDVSAIWGHIESLERRGLVAEHGSPPRFTAVPTGRGADLRGRVPEL